MLDPAELLRHARRMVAGDASEAAERRAVSGCYYAVFHRLAQAAARICAPDANAGLTALLCRTAEHREFRRVCEMLGGPAGGRGELSAIFPAGIPPSLAQVAVAFCALQDARHAADYDMVARPTPAAVTGALETAEFVFEHLGTPTPDMRAFLTLLLLPPRRRRG